MIPSLRSAGFSIRGCQRIKEEPQRIAQRLRKRRTAAAFLDFLVITFKTLPLVSVESRRLRSEPSQRGGWGGGAEFAGRDMDFCLRHRIFFVWPEQHFELYSESEHQGATPPPSLPPQWFEWSYWLSRTDITQD